MIQKGNSIDRIYLLQDILHSTLNILLPRYNLGMDKHNHHIHLSNHLSRFRWGNLARSGLQNLVKNLIHNQDTTQVTGNTSNEEYKEHKLYLQVSKK